MSRALAASARDIPHQVTALEPDIRHRYRRRAIRGRRSPASEGAYPMPGDGASGGQALASAWRGLSHAFNAQLFGKLARARRCPSHAGRRRIRRSSACQRAVHYPTRSTRSFSANSPEREGAHPMPGDGASGGQALASVRCSLSHASTRSFPPALTSARRCPSHAGRRRIGRLSARQCAVRHIPHVNA